MMQAATFFKALPASAENVLAGTSSPIKGQSETEFSELFSQIEGLSVDGKDMEATPDGLIAQATMLDLLLAHLPKPVMGAEATPDGEIAPMAMVDLDRIKENLPVITEAIFGEDSVVSEDTGKLLLQSMLGMGTQARGTASTRSAEAEAPLTSEKVGGIISLLTEFDGTSEDLKFEIQSLLYTIPRDTEGTKEQAAQVSESGKSGAGSMVDKVNQTNQAETRKMVSRSGAETSGYLIDPSSFVAVDDPETKYRFIHEHKDWEPINRSVVGETTVNLDQTGIDKGIRTESKGVPVEQINRLPMREAIEAVKLSLQEEAVTKTQAQELKVVAEVATKVENQAVRQQAENLLAKGGTAVVQPATEGRVETKSEPNRTKVEQAAIVDKPSATKTEVTTQAVVEKSDVTESLLKKGHSTKEVQDIDFDQAEVKQEVKAEFNVSQATHIKEVASTGKPEQVRIDVGQISEAVEQVSDLIAARRPGKMEVRLNPEELGTINITVQQTGTRTDIEIQASDERVRHVLNVHRQDMVQTLESKGMTVGTVNLGDAPQADVNGQGRSQQEQTSRKEFEQAVNLRGSQETGFQMANDDRPAYRSMTQVDYTA